MTKQSKGLHKYGLVSGFMHFFLILVLGLIVFAGIGYWAYKNGQIKINSFDAPLTSPTPASLVNTTNWKTYVNTEHNYKVKYPPIWKAVEENGINQDYLFFTPPDWIQGKLSDGNITIRVENYGKNVRSNDQASRKFQDFMKSCIYQSCTEKNSDDYKFEKQLEIAETLAFQTFGGCCLDIGRHIFMYKNIDVYRITLYNLTSDPNNFKNEDVFDQILSTFKFLEALGDKCKENSDCISNYCSNISGTIPVYNGMPQYPPATCRIPSKDLPQ